MNVREIHALRKAGNLAEAMKAAENEFATDANVYTAGALFWCLYDFAKQQTGEEVAATRDRMQAIYNEYCSGDEYMRKSLASLSHRLAPHCQELKDAVDRGKNGQDVRPDYDKFARIFDSEGLDADMLSTFGWLIYFALRHTPLNDAQTRKRMLNTYLKLGLPRPSNLHSSILREAVKVEQNTPLQFRIRDFMRLWGLENLREEDWEQYHTADGNTASSLVEKLISVYAKELKTDGVESPGEFSLLVDKALERYPKSQNLPYCKATVLVSQGRRAEALEYYRELLLRYPSKHYLWSQSAVLVDDMDTRMGLLCKALTCGVGDEFLGGVRLRLAEMLMQRDMRAEAKHELENYRKTYIDKGWALKSEFRILYGRLAGVAPVESNKALYEEFGVSADGFVYSSLPMVTAVKVADRVEDDRNHPGRKTTTWILRTEASVVRLRKPQKFGLDRRTTTGTVFDVRMHQGKVVWIRRHVGMLPESWLRLQGGTVSLRTDRNGRKYAILGGSYIGENLLKGTKEGDPVKIISMRQQDGRWSAVAVL